MPHARRSIRLRGYDYAQAGAYFVTICAHQRLCLFGEIAEGAMKLNTGGRVVAECWEAIPAHFPDVELDAFCVMPNHVHGVMVITQPVGATHASPLPSAGPARRSLGAIIGSFKSAATKRIRELHHAPGFGVWQRNYYEHVVRDESDLNRIRVYITNNPRRWAEDQHNPAPVKG